MTHWNPLNLSEQGMSHKAIHPVTKLTPTKHGGLHAAHIQPFRSYEEYRATPGIEIATSFAEACNMHSLRRLKEVLAPDVRYVSTWARVRMRGRTHVIHWFRRCFRRQRGVHYYRAQVVVLPMGSAAVHVEIMPRGDSALVQFIASGNKASVIIVNSRYTAEDLRLTGYFPPEA